MSNHPAL